VGAGARARAIGGRSWACVCARARVCVRVSVRKCLLWQSSSVSVCACCSRAQRSGAALIACVQYRAQAHYPQCPVLGVLGVLHELPYSLQSPPTIAQLIHPPSAQCAPSSQVRVGQSPPTHFTATLTVVSAYATDPGFGCQASRCTHRIRLTHSSNPEAGRIQDEGGTCGCPHRM